MVDAALIQRQKILDHVLPEQPFTQETVAQEKLHLCRSLLCRLIILQKNLLVDWIVVLHKITSQAPRLIRRAFLILQRLKLCYEIFKTLGAFLFDLPKRKNRSQRIHKLRHIDAAVLHKRQRISRHVRSACAMRRIQQIIICLLHCSTVDHTLHIRPLLQDTFQRIDPVDHLIKICHHPGSILAGTLQRLRKTRHRQIQISAVEDQIVHHLTQIFRQRLTVIMELMQQSDLLPHMINAYLGRASVKRLLHIHRHLGARLIIMHLIQ